LSNKQIKSSFLIFAWIMTLTLIFFIHGQVAAQESNPQPSDDEVNAVAKQLFCPVCENISLDVCPTQACAQWRALIGEKLTAGWSEQQIKDYFVLQYGDRVLAEPPRRGLNWMIYILPPVIILLGAFILFRVLFGMRQPAADSFKPAVQAEQDVPYLSRLEEELRNKDR
jgi:cytochrome c-type biogenesis protein CcmH